MIEVDISNIWGGISLPDLLSIEKEISAAHEQLLAGADTEGPQLDKILETAETIRNSAQVCVIAAAADICSGIRAAMELLPLPKDGPQVLFAGDTLSTRQWNQLNRQLEGRDFSLIVISQTGTTLESAIAFRGLRWLMERRYGTEEAARRIYTVTGQDSPLWQMAQNLHWSCLALPQNGYGCGSVLSPAGLLPMAVAGIDVSQLVQGAKAALERYSLRSFENPLWLYAGARNALFRKGNRIELFGGFESGFRQLGFWWQQLFSQSEGSTGRGIFPVPVEYPQDLHSLGPRLQAGERALFETMVYFETEAVPYDIVSDVSDLDGLNSMAGKSLEDIRQQEYRRVVSEHCDCGVPVIAMDCGRLDAEILGELFGFFLLASGISAHIPA